MTIAPEPEKYDAHITIKVPGSFKAALDGAAAERFVTTSELVRTVLAAFLARLDDDKGER